MQSRPRVGTAAVDALQPREQRIERNGLPQPRINTHIHRASLHGKSTVRMSVQHHRPLELAAPQPQGPVACVHAQSIGAGAPGQQIMHAIEQSVEASSSRIVVAAHQRHAPAPDALAHGLGVEALRLASFRVWAAEIAKVQEHIALGHAAIDSIEQRFIHRPGIGKRAPEQGQGLGFAEMRVGRDPDAASHVVRVVEAMPPTLMIRRRMLRGRASSALLFRAVDRHFLQIEGMSRAELDAMLMAAESNLPIAEQRQPRKHLLDGRVVANLFLEDSTRTRCSFETAVHRLGGQVFTLTAAGSSASKGEGLIDTALNVEAMGVSAIVIRTSISGGPAMVAKRLRIPVINAGDGRHEHPTQGLLDLVTLRESLGDLTGRRIGIVGDIANSRVAHSAVQGLSILGANVVLVGPPTLVNASQGLIAKTSEKISITHDLDSIIGELDAIMLLRIQMERGASSGISDDYRTMFGLTQDRAKRLQPHAVVLHPGPVNRGIEIDDAVADEHGGIRILRQVTHGVAARMAVMEWALAR